MSLARQRITPQEYLALERASEVRHEYFNGSVYAMAGAKERHNLVTSNVSGELHARFKGRGCKVHSSDMRVKVDTTGLYTYPDVVALCGPARFEDDEQDTLVNPALIVEVLSPPTEAYDRGEKFAHYRRIASVTDYLLISPDRLRVEHSAAVRMTSHRIRGR